MDVVELINNSKKENVWSLGNKILYDLCENHPGHKNDQEIIAKIHLIGRTYAAAIERRKIKNKNINDDFYIDVVLPEIKNSDIDTWFKDLRKSKDDTVILGVHKEIVNLFYKISGLEKRSLASKYLHFHFPNLYYMYDTRAVASLRVLQKKLISSPNIKTKENQLYDAEYYKFYMICKELHEYMQEKYSVKLSCREFDNILIQIANDNLRNKLKSVWGIK